MLYSFEKREDLGKSNELASLNDQVKAVRLQDKIGKQSFQEDLKKFFEPMTDIVKDVSNNNKTKTVEESSIKKPLH